MTLRKYNVSSHIYSSMVPVVVYLMMCNRCNITGVTNFVCLYTSVCTLSPDIDICQVDSLGGTDVPDACSPGDAYLLLFRKNTGVYSVYVLFSIIRSTSEASGSDLLHCRIC